MGWLLLAVLVWLIAFMAVMVYITEIGFRRDLENMRIDTAPEDE